MDSWLNTLISEKQQAIERYAEIHDIAKIRVGHEEIIRILYDLQVEHHLLALAHKVMDGHPDIPSANLRRVVRTTVSKEIYKPIDSQMFESGELWAKPPRGGLVLPIPKKGTCPPGYLFESIQWDLNLGVVKQSAHSRIRHGIRTLLTPEGLKVNGHTIPDGYVTAFQQALVNGYHSPITWEIVPPRG